MAKKVIKKRKKSAKAKQPSLLFFYLRNAIVAISIGFAFYWILDRPKIVETNPVAKQAYQSTPTYWYVGGFHTLWHDITGRKVNRIYEIKEKYPQLSVTDRYSTKFGQDFSLIKSIVAKTPEDAHIYLPPEDAWPPQFKHIPGKREAWLAFFFYPRQASPAKSADIPPPPEITHILLTPKWGAQFIDQQLSPQQKKGVLIVKLPESK